MNKQMFLQLIRQPGAITEDQLRDLEKFAEQYPYCQPAHVLIAKYYADHGHMLAGLKVKKAALYSADRTNLKSIIESTSSNNEELLKKTASYIQENTSQPVLNKIENPELNEPVTKKVVEPVVENKESEIVLETKHTETTIAIESIQETAIKKEEVSEKDQLLEELRQSLISLRESRKKAFIQKEKEPEETVEHLTNSEYSTPVIELETIPAQDSIQEPVVEEKQEILELEKAQTILETKEIESKEEKLEVDTIVIDPNHYYPNRGPISMPQAKEYKALQDHEVDLISGYYNYLNQKRLVFKKNKRKEEEIIERLSKEEPVMPKLNAKSLPEESADLSTKSTTLQKGPISENFAKILVLQGKTDKAIEIYSELSLKFPEKKAYFEAQIEKLKTKL